MFTIPTAAAVVSSSTLYATSWFTQFTPLLYLAVGMTVAVVGYKFVQRWLTGSVKRAAGGGRRGGRRRR